MIFKQFPDCGAYLDPGEKCDCEKEGGETDDLCRRIQGVQGDYADRADIRNACAV